MPGSRTGRVFSIPHRAQTSGPSLLGVESSLKRAARCGKPARRTVSLLESRTRTAKSPRRALFSDVQGEIRQRALRGESEKSTSCPDLMFTIWFVVTGALLIGMALAGTVLKRLPLTASMFYLTAGALLGPWGVGLLHVDAVDDASILERLTEIAVIISLFTAG